MFSKYDLVNETEPFYNFVCNQNRGTEISWTRAAVITDFIQSLHRDIYIYFFPFDILVT